MTPPKAALICEENPQCGGFTYKVREPIKYYAAEYLRKEQMGWYPQFCNLFFWQKNPQRGRCCIPPSAEFLTKKSAIFSPF